MKTLQLTALPLQATRLPMPQQSGYVPGYTTTQSGFDMSAMMSMMMSIMVMVMMMKMMTGVTDKM